MSEPLGITITDASGKPASGATVGFWLENGGKAELNVGTVTTGETGKASARLKLGRETREYTVGAHIHHRESEAEWWSSRRSPTM